MSVLTPEVGDWTLTIAMVQRLPALFSLGLKQCRNIGSASQVTAKRDASHPFDCTLDQITNRRLTFLRNGRSKKYRLQELQKPFVLVHFSAWASLEKNVNKRASGAPVIYTSWEEVKNTVASQHVFRYNPYTGSFIIHSQNKILLTSLTSPYRAWLWLLLLKINAL